VTDNRENLEILELTSFHTRTHTTFSRISAGVLKEPPFGVIISDLFHCYANNPTNNSAHCERWDEKTGWHFYAKREYSYD
jgi:hypothetical protein